MGFGKYAGDICTILSLVHLLIPGVSEIFSAPGGSRGQEDNFLKVYLGPGTKDHENGESTDVDVRQWVEVGVDTLLGALFRKTRLLLEEGSLGVQFHIF